MEILAIPLNGAQPQDQWVWKENRSQQFSMKSAYQVDCHLQQPGSVEHSAARGDRPIKKKVWALNVLPKVWNFVWRACSNILPTRDNLCKKKLNIAPYCDICCQSPETIGQKCVGVV